MLTWAELEALVDSGELKVWAPRPGAQVRAGDRALYMLPDVFDEVLKKPWPGIAPGELPTRTRERRSAMRAVLERYANGGLINVERDMTELGSKLRRPQHRGWWEFRSGPPSVETRLFGFFARKGAFVATDLLARDEIDFVAQHVVCRRKWDELTGGRAVLDSPYPVENREHMDDYLSREADD